MIGQKAFSDMTEEELEGIIIRIKNHDKNENWINLEGAQAELLKRIKSKSSEGKNNGS